MLHIWEGESSVLWQLANKIHHQISVIKLDSIRSLTFLFHTSSQKGNLCSKILCGRGRPMQSNGLPLSEVLSKISSHRDEMLTHTPKTSDVGKSWVQIPTPSLNLWYKSWVWVFEVPLTLREFLLPWIYGTFLYNFFALPTSYWCMHEERIFN